MIFKISNINDNNDNISLSYDDRIMLEMARAYEKGISPYEFRKSWMSDINFLMDYQEALNILKEKREHAAKVNQAMEMLKNGRSW